ncbi:hypothetical protein HZR00_08400 [Elizabethkingia anophelis]|nr:hypothetical protein [Elizabethkingia anophelis]
MIFKTSDNKAIINANNKDALLKLLVRESDKGYVRINNASDDLGISISDLKEVHRYLTWTWKKDCIKSNKDYELWIDAQHVPEIKHFLDSGGFTQIEMDIELDRQYKKEGIKRAKEANKIAWIAIGISFIAFILAVYAQYDQ